MKKGIKGFVLLVAICALGYYGFTRYKKASAFSGVIHENADSAFRIEIHDIRETLFWDAVTSPKYYYNNKNSSEKDSDDTEAIGNGITIPYNLFLYSVPDIKHTFFSTFEIYNTTEFEIFIKESLADRAVNIQKSETEDYYFVLLKDVKLILAWNDEKMVVAASLKPSFEKVVSVFTDILTNDKTIKDRNHELLEALKNQSGHIVYSNGKDLTTVNFTDGEVQMNGSIATATKAVFPKEISLETMPNTSLSLYFDSNFSNEYLKEKFIENLNGATFLTKNNLGLSKIADRTNGFFSLEIKGKTIQNDTIITYEYDDNFEKVAQKTVQEKEVPKIYMNLGAENESLKDYLIEVDAVTTDDIFTPFPLYQVYAKEDAMYTYFSTDRNARASQRTITTNFLECTIDFNKLQEDLSIPQTKQLFSLLSDFRVRALQGEGKKIAVKGSLTGKHSDINIISQLFFGMQSEKSNKTSESGV